MVRLASPSRKPTRVARRRRIPPGSVVRPPHGGRRTSPPPPHLRNRQDTTVGRGASSPGPPLARDRGHPTRAVDPGGRSTRQHLQESALNKRTDDATTGPLAGRRWDGLARSLDLSQRYPRPGPTIRLRGRGSLPEYLARAAGPVAKTGRTRLTIAVRIGRGKRLPASFWIFSLRSPPARGPARAQWLIEDLGLIDDWPRSGHSFSRRQPSVEGDHRCDGPRAATRAGCAGPDPGATDSGLWGWNDFAPRIG
jgi:hypothetical protein